MNATFDANSNLTSFTESVWNVPPGVRTDCNGNPTSGGATGGGVSTMVARPSYQSNYSQPGEAHGVPAGTKRVLPDVTLLAGNPGVLVAISGSYYISGGTSASSPLFAAMTSLVNQYKGSAQGSPNNELYRQGAVQYDYSGPAAFRDITAGNNATTGRGGCTTAAAPGYAAVIGYDAASGWGAPLLAAFAQGIPGSGLRVSSVSRLLPSQHIVVVGSGPPNQLLNVAAAPIVNGTYTSLTTVTTSITGAFSFEDTNAPSFSERFYKFSY